jgi:hypothetical protein
MRPTAIEVVHRLQGLVFGIVGALAIPVDRIELFR